VVETGADIGIALDGDGDRVFFVDETGRTVPPAIIRGILSKIILEREPGSSVAYDIRPGRITLDMIMEYGGEPVLTKVGHSLIKERAAEEGCIFAGESSGHFFHLTSFGFFEYPELTVLWILEELSKSGKTLSEYIAPLDTYAHSGEINFSVDNKQAVFDRLIEHYAEGLAYDFDGVTFEFDEFWFNVRASNTEEKVRLNMEGYDEAVLNEKVEEVSKIIRGE
jgi:phosphomannomutase